VSMLGDLQNKVNLEGEDAAKTYNKFACFCKDGITKKSAAITAGETEKTRLEAEINKDTQERGAEGGLMETKSQEISTDQDEVAKKKSAWVETVLKFEKDEVDLTGALADLEGAIQTLKASKTGVSFAQLKPVADTVSRAVLIADALDLAPSAESRHIVSVLMTGGVPSETYTFKSDSIISTLEDLKKTFRGKKVDLLKEHATATHTYDTTQQDLTDQIALATTAFEAHKKNIADISARIAVSSSDFTTVSAQLLDDQEYLKELNSQCTEKSLLWVKRVQVRADELQALTQAIKILNTDVQRIPASTAFLQMLKVESHPRRINLVKVHSNVGHQSHQARGRTPLGRRARVIGLLKSQANRLHSVALMRLAASAEGGDPFGKVRTLIEQLIVRLLRNAAHEANEKGYCDKELALSTQKRDYNSQDITDINARLAESEARINKLNDFVAKLNAELVDLSTKKTDADVFRVTEKAENQKTIEEATKSQEAVAKAIKILDEFYKTAAKNAFLQKAPPLSDAPDAGFDGGYAGNQGGGVSVIAMLEVVSSDFARTITDTQKAETDAEATHLEFTTASGKSVAAKTVAKEAHSTALSAAGLVVIDDTASLQSAVDGLNMALGAIKVLHERCNNSGMTAAERKIAREGELAALKQALCILEAHGSSAASNC